LFRCCAVFLWRMPRPVHHTDLDLRCDDTAFFASHPLEFGGLNFAVTALLAAGCFRILGAGDPHGTGSVGLPLQIVQHANVPRSPGKLRQPAQPPVWLRPAFQKPQPPSSAAARMGHALSFFGAHTVDLGSPVFSASARGTVLRPDGRAYRFGGRLAVQRLRASIHNPALRGIACGLNAPAS